jgi:pilus assembly protein FimV
LIAQGEPSPVHTPTWLNYGGPLALASFVLLALIVLLKLSKNDAKQRDVQAPMPEHAAKLFASLDLNLDTIAKAPSSTARVVDEDLPSAEALRVKLNLVKAYITIEDFGAARRSLDEILAVSNQVDPDITIAAKALIAQIDER